jgi:hypothetical protein
MSQFVGIREYNKTDRCFTLYDAHQHTYNYDLNIRSRRKQNGDENGAHVSDKYVIL